MGYRLKPGESIANEVTRIVNKQLDLAILELRKSGAPRPDDAIHEARRHVKKIRAVIRLVQPALGDFYKASNRRLRAASRLLAPIADGRAVVDTVARLHRKHGLRPDGQALPAIRAALVERAARIYRRSETDDVLLRVSALLRAERERVSGWTLTARGFGAIAPGLERSVRRARRAMRHAVRHPTAGHYHAWRQRVKDLWFHVRLIGERVGGKLQGIERTLEALDGCLGEYHDVVVLEGVLTGEAPLPRPETAASLRLLRRYQRELRREASRLGRRVLAEKPRHFVRRVRPIWRSETRRRIAASRRQTWRQAA